MKHLRFRLILSFLIISCVSVYAQEYPSGCWVRQVTPNSVPNQTKTNSNYQKRTPSRQQHNYNGDDEYYYSTYRQATFQSLDQSKYPKGCGVKNVAPQRNMGIALDGTLYYDSYGKSISRYSGTPSKNQRPKNVNQSRFKKDIQRANRKQVISYKNPTGTNIKAARTAERSIKKNY